MNKEGNDKCRLCRYVQKSENDMPCYRCKEIVGSEFHPITNGDRIRTMSDEELALFLHCHISQHDAYTRIKTLISFIKCWTEQDLISWLKEEVDLYDPGYSE